MNRTSRAEIIERERESRVVEEYILPLQNLKGKTRRKQRKTFNAGSVELGITSSTLDRSSMFFCTLLSSYSSPILPNFYILLSQFFGPLIIVILLLSSTPQFSNAQSSPCLKVVTPTICATRKSLNRINATGSQAYPVPVFILLVAIRYFGNRQGVIIYLKNGKFQHISGG